MTPVYLTIIMIIAGAAGGCVNFLLSQGVAPSASDASTSEKPLKWWSYLVIGIVATFVVPLFLSLAQSNLFESMFDGDGLSAKRVFVFVGFCLIASISSRAFIQTVSDRILALARQAAKDAQETKRDLALNQERVKTKIDEISEVIGEQIAEAEPHEESPPSLQPTAEKGIAELTREEIRVLYALQSKAYKRRTLRGVAQDSGLTTGRTRELFGKLELENLVREIPSKKTGNLLYEITSIGAYALRQPQAHQYLPDLTSNPGF